MRTLVLSVLMLAACAQPAKPVNETAVSPPSSSQPLSVAAQRVRAELARLDQELRAPGVFAAGLNETADLGGGLTVTPLEILEDSRCPVDVTCIWAGRLRLRANVSGQQAEMTLGETTQTAHGAVLLAIVLPSPFSEWPEAEIGPRPAYRFGFRRN